MNKKIMSKKTVALVLIAVFCISVFSGCAKNNGESEALTSTDLLATVTPAPHPMKEVKDDETTKKTTLLGENLIPNGDFSQGISGWSKIGVGEIGAYTDEDATYGACLRFAGKEGSQHSFSAPLFNFYPYIKESGNYTISFDIKTTENDAGIKGQAFKVIIRSAGAPDENSFIQKSESSGQYYNSAIVFDIDGEVGEWQHVSFDLSVEDDDIDEKKHQWNFTFHLISDGVGEIYLDNFAVQKEQTEENTSVQKNRVLVDSCETWKAEEMTFIGNNSYTDGLTETLDLILTNGTKTLTVPGFWDGGNVWKVRFALPEAGVWNYETKFSAEDEGINGIKGTVKCSAYSGDLDIYKHGFVQNEAGKKYFTYADGTPFFYLGDTHWSFLSEEFDSSGDHNDGIETSSHFKYIVNKRVSQGFTVYQSEPLNATFDFLDGITVSDLKGLQSADKYFKYIADQGLVHANAQFFFSSSMITLMNKYSGKEDEMNDYLEKISRYWVARFGAYPVMYTLAQEVDNDYYFNENQKTNTTMNADNNPWKKVCEYIDKYDAYNNPISAHQEGSSSFCNSTTATNSAFNEIPGHSWWATQWKPVLNKKTDFTGAIDFWKTEKPAVMYEGRYDHLWTNEYGARAQGWIAFLNGMFGYGYGAVDIWLYKSTYDIDHDTNRDGIVTTVKDKDTHWGTAIEFPSGYQMQYMKEFFSDCEWWKLVPCFGTNEKFVVDDDKNAYGCCATVNENELYIAYFYGESSATGKIINLDKNAEYTYQWYNPRTTATSEPKKIKKGTEFNIGERPSAEDWVLTVKKSK